MAAVAVTDNIRVFKTQNAFIWAFVIGIIVISTIQTDRKRLPTSRRVGRVGAWERRYVALPGEPKTGSPS